MPYKVASLNQTVAWLVAAYRTFFPLANVGSRFSYHWKRIKVYAMGVADLHAHIARLFDDVMPDRATGIFLDRWAKILGLTRKTATPARKADALRIRGLVGATVAAGTALYHEASGLRFKVNEDIIIPAGLFFDADVVAISTGALTRLEAAEVLLFEATPVNIEPQTTLQLALDEDGYNQESDGELRVRVLDRLANPPQGGSQADFVSWIVQVLGISRGYAYPNRAGVGSVDLVGLHTGSDTARILTADEVTSLMAYIRTKAVAYLAGTGGALRHLTVVPDPINIEIGLSPFGTTWEFDWVDQTPPVVLAYNAGLRRVQFTAPRPGSMKVGHRLTIKGVASTQDGRQYTIEQLVDADKVVLRVAPQNDPVATDIIYSGGPLVDVVRNAVAAHIDGDTLYVGPDGPLPARTADSTVNLKILADGVGTANPGGVYGDWSGDVVVAILYKIATSPRGVRNAQVFDPAVDYIATDYAVPLDDQIGMATWSNILIRRSW